MELDNRIFKISNPSRILDAVLKFVSNLSGDLSKILIFFPTYMSSYVFKHKLIKQYGESIKLPKIVVLGADENDEEFLFDKGLITNSEREMILAKILMADSNVKKFSTALPIAQDLVRMQDYLFNQGIIMSDIEWEKVVDEQYANHFQNKARILDIVKKLPKNRYTINEKRNMDIQNWMQQITNYSHVIVCGSDASIPVVSDLMTKVSEYENGYIFLPGKIDGEEQDFVYDTNPYKFEYNFLKHINKDYKNICTFDIGNSDMDIFNLTFSNSGKRANTQLKNCKFIECVREGEEAATIAEIISDALSKDKNVMVVSNDFALNYRLVEEFKRKRINAYISKCLPGSNTDIGRSILNLFNGWIENNQYSEFNKLYEDSQYNLYDMLFKYISADEEHPMFPKFDVSTDISKSVLDSVQRFSNVLFKNNIIFSLVDAKAFMLYVLNSIYFSIGTYDSKCWVLNSVDSRLQTADVIIIPELNDGIYPTMGYTNSWLPRPIADKIGLPKPEYKISSMALDFIGLSTGKEVYWLRSKQQGNVANIESRFLSRLRITVGELPIDEKYIQKARDRDNIPYNPMSKKAPVPPIDKTDVYVTELDLLVHNPYAFYARHILRLQPMDDYWILPDARNFGNIVHSVIENAKDYTASSLLEQMDEQARQVLPKDSLSFYFWHKRFCDICPLVEQFFANRPNGRSEILGRVNIAGRNVKARADWVWSDMVMDIKTGAAPTKKQLEEGMIPQLPIEGYILQNGGFGFKSTDKVPILQFLQFQNKHLKLVSYTDVVAQTMIDNSVQKIKELFGQYCSQPTAYEYRVTTGKKYHAWDDLARIED